MIDFNDIKSTFLLFVLNCFQSKGNQTLWQLCKKLRKNTSIFLIWQKFTTLQKWSNLAILWKMRLFWWFSTTVHLTKELWNLQFFFALMKFLFFLSVSMIHPHRNFCNLVHKWNFDKIPYWTPSFIKTLDTYPSIKKQKQKSI